MTGEDVLRQKFRLTGEAGRVTRLEISGANPPEISWSRPDDTSRRMLLSSEYHSDNAVLDVQWPCGEPVDLLFSWTKLDLFQRPDALAALSVIRSPEVPKAERPLAADFAVVRGPVSFPTGVVASRARPAGSSASGSDQAGAINRAIETLFGGKRPDGPNCRLVVRIDRQMTMGNNRQLEVAIPIAEELDCVTFRKNTC